MRKLLQYELKEHYLPLMILSAIFALCAFGYVGCTKFYIATDTTPQILLHIISGLCGTLAYIVLLLLVIAHILLIVSTFGRGLFGDCGYLLFCLPIGIDTILLAKILSCFILIGSSVCFCGFVGAQVLLLPFDTSAIQLLKEIIAYAQNIDINGHSVFITLASITYVLGSILTWLMYIILTLALLNIWRITNYRFILGVLIFLGICLCGNIISTSIKLCFAYMDFSSTIGSQISIHSLQIYIQQLIIYLLLSGSSYVLARYCIIKKMELE